MQVSWIDPDEIRELVAKLEGPRKAPPQVAWEVHTLPVQPPASPTAEALLGVPEMRPQPPVSAPAPPPDLPLNDKRSGPDGGEIWSIREQLRSLRERAEVSGIVPVAPPVPVESESRIKVEPPVEPKIAADEPRPVAPALSPEARAAMDELLGPVGPQPELPPSTDPSLLPPPMRPPTSSLPSSIEYEGPPPNGEASEPLFGIGHVGLAIPDPEVDSSLDLEEALEAVEPEAVRSPFTLAESTEEAPFSPAVETEMPGDQDAFVAPALGLSDRLHALATWAGKRLCTKELLLVDDYGDVLWGGHEHTALVLAAMMAWQSSQRASAESVYAEQDRIDKEISPGRHLTVIPMRTLYGTVSLAAICEMMMSENDAREVRAALIKAVEG